MSKYAIWALVGGMSVGGAVSLTWAEADHTARIVTPPSRARIGDGRNYDTYVINRNIVDRSSVVSRSLSEQPVRPHLIEVRVVNQTIYLDPKSEDFQEMLRRLPANHSIRQAFAVWSAQVNNGARIVTNNPNETGDMAMGVTNPQPLMILEKPGNGTQPIPMVPRAPKENKDELQLVLRPVD
ncbi:MAG: hypothetical protein GC164_15710 [Phycisphaera sp.]|nr:hypothetical protein [Phycisphaera sp.]